MDVLGQSAFLIAVTSFALGFSTLARNVRNKLFITFAILCTLTSAWALFYYAHVIWPWRGYYRMHLLFNIWLAPATLALIRLMIRIQSPLSLWMFRLSLIAAAPLSVALLFHQERTFWGWHFICFFPAVILIQIVQLMWIDRKSSLPTVGLGRRHLIYLGGVFVLLTSVMDHVPWLGKVIPVIGNLSLTVYLFFLSQAISQQRLLNLGALFSRFLVLLTVALSLTVVYLLMVAWIENSPGLFFLNSFIASFFILTLLDPLRTMARYFTQQLLTQKDLKLDQALREAQRRLAGILDPAGLYQAILDTAVQTLRPQWVAIFILHKDGTRYRRALVQGHEPETVSEILADHALLEYCERLQKKGALPILLDQVLENERDRSASRTQRDSLAGLLEGLRALGGNLLIPLFDSGSNHRKVSGFVVIQIPAPPEEWGGNWGLLQVIYPYFEQAAKTLRNMEVFVRQKEIERLAALGEMAAGLAHEIRNPLGAIKGAAQFLDPTANRPESRFLGVIVEEVDRLNRVVTQFLDYSKPGTTDFSRTDVCALSEKVVQLLRPTVPRGVTLAFAASELPLWVLGAPEQIQQVLLNLIQNSLSATAEKPGAGNISVSVRIGGVGARREVAIGVDDNGVGIRPENLDKLFIPFFTTSPAGTGLGLSICQKIIEAHSGRIEVQSEVGRFARFTVFLPSHPESGS